MTAIENSNVTFLKSWSDYLRRSAERRISNKVENPFLESSIKSLAENILDALMSGELERLELAVSGQDEKALALASGLVTNHLKGSGITMMDPCVFSLPIGALRGQVVSVNVCWVRITVGATGKIVYIPSDLRAKSFAVLPFGIGVEDKFSVDSTLDVYKAAQKLTAHIGRILNHGPLWVPYSSPAARTRSTRRAC